MRYAKGDSLRKKLPNIVRDKWIIKLKKLYHIISGLNMIHHQKFIHCDLHHGNILNLHDKLNNLTISDLGLCFIRY